MVAIALSFRTPRAMAEGQHQAPAGRAALATPRTQHFLIIWTTCGHTTMVQNIVVIAAIVLMLWCRLGALD